MCCERASQLSPLLIDGPPPPGAAPCGLIAPFQQMHHEHCQPTCQFSILTFTHRKESLRLQGGILRPEISSEDLIRCKRTALRKRVQACIVQNYLARMGVGIGKKLWDLGL